MKKIYIRIPFAIVFAATAFLCFFNIGNLPKGNEWLWIGFVVSTGALAWVMNSIHEIRERQAIHKSFKNRHQRLKEEKRQLIVMHYKAIIEEVRRNGSVNPNMSQEPFYHELAHLYDMSPSSVKKIIREDQLDEK